eukprot:6490653-Pyramimonas_sp.AAC.1
MTRRRGDPIGNRRANFAETPGPQRSPRVPRGLRGPEEEPSTSKSPHPRSSDLGNVDGDDDDGGSG